MSGKYQRKRRAGCGFLLVLLLLFAVLVLECTVGNSILQEQTVQVTLSDLSESFDGFRILQISDLHGAQFGDGNEKLIKAVRDAQPDIIAVTGDVLQTEQALAQLGPLAQALVQIAPVYYVTGNHEWAAGLVRQVENILTEAGVVVLQNDYCTLTAEDGARLIVAGVDDPNGPADAISPRDFIFQTVSDNPSVPIILLAHRNEPFRYTVEGKGADLILSGHGHGGIIRLPGLGGLVGTALQLLPDFDAGLYDIGGGTQMFVSRGLGNTEWEKRIFNHPQLPIIVLHAEKTAEK